ncbi:MAG: ankyrin repeat domain-containing protein [Oligoflexia bacterium]|nr:ankyrin repeat domain-containing protein [Oligoflexia bacterium]
MKNRFLVSLIGALLGMILTACAPKVELKDGGSLIDGNKKYENGRISRGGNAETAYQIPLLKLDAIQASGCINPFLSRRDLESDIRFANAECVKKGVEQFSVNLNQVMTDAFGSPTQLPLLLAISENALFFNKDNPALIPALLISLGADVNINTRGPSILERAMELPYGSYGPLAHYLLELPATRIQTTSRGGTFLEKAIQLKSPQFISHLLDRGAEVNPRGATSSPLHQAIQQSLEPSALQLLQAGASVSALNPSNETPLHLAIERGMGALTTAILAKNPPLNQQDNRGYTPLHLAAIAGQADTVSRLIAAQADLELRDASGRTALFAATEGGRGEIVERLLQARSAVDTTDNAQRSLLLVAKEPAIALRLIQAGAPVDLKAQTGETPLSVHASLNQLEVVKALAARGASLQWKDKSLRGLLHVAVDSDALQTARYLLDQGLSAQAESLDKRTPLFEVRSVPMLSLLVQVKAEINHLDDRGLSALYAPLIQRHDVELARAFLDRGADVNWGAELSTSYLLALLKGVFFLTPELENSILETTKLLLSRGIRAEIMERDSGRPAFHFLADNANLANSGLLIPLCQAFRDHGAPFGLRDGNGLTLGQKLQRRRDAAVRERDEKIARAGGEPEKIERIRESYRPLLERFDNALAIVGG